MRIIAHVIKVLSIAILAISASVWANSSLEQASASEDKASKVLAEWSFLTYIQADNSLTGFDSLNVTDMQKGVVSTLGSNVLVQWDQAKNNKTWRYQIVPGGVVEAGSLNTEMGTYPENELVDAMKWVVQNFPAKHYALILWNHGSGIEDITKLLQTPFGTMPKVINSWLQIPGAPTMHDLLLDRGILYDDSQGTVLTNQALTSALSKIKTMIGKNLDIIGMDACLMAMLEVAYQVKDYANYFVASQQTEPGNGWPYSLFLKPLTTNPATTTPLQLAQNIVSAYKLFYTGNKDAADFTLSAIDLAGVASIKQNIDQLMIDIAACHEIDGRATKALLVAARKVSTELYMREYIDLYSFYAALLDQAQRISRSEPKSNKILAQLNKDDGRAKLSQEYLAALNTVKSTLFDGTQKLLAAIVKNVSGPQLANVQGLSIYYPKTGAIHASYPPTMFAKNSTWINFIQTYR